MRITVLSLGAGVQSTTLALMAVEGVLPKPDAAIFADTGWEPKRVYDHLNRLGKALDEAGIPLHRVSRGNLRDDVLSPHTQAGIPYFTLGPLRREVVIDESRPCPAWCGWDAYHEALADLDDLADDEDGLTPPVKPLPCEGCDSRGITVVRSHVEWRRVKGMGSRRCTGRYKVEPIEREIRQLLGAEVRQVPCRFCDAAGSRVPPWDADAGLGPCSVCRGSGTRNLVGPVPAGATAVQWIGFSNDEASRVNDNRFPPYITPQYPLLGLGMSRDDCLRWLESRGWDHVVKSACVGCPFHGNAQWRELRDTCECGHHRDSHFHISDTERGACRILSPANKYGNYMCSCLGFQASEWEDAVAFDAEFRTAPGMASQRYLHASRVPLDQAPIDRLSQSERRGQQLGLFDVEEFGDPDGCSPYGCRSGEPVRAGA